MIAYILVAGLLANSQFQMQALQQYETMNECVLASARIVDRAFVHCVVVKKEAEEKQEEQPTQQEKRFVF